MWIQAHTIQPNQQVDQLKVSKLELVHNICITFNTFCSGPNTTPFVTNTISIFLNLSGLLDTT